MTTTNTTAPVDQYIRNAIPWGHGHQIKAMAVMIEAILEHQTGIQAGLVRSLGNQEAGQKQLSRLIHNKRLDPRRLAEAVLQQALTQLPKTGRVRLALDWTIEDDQHLLVVSLLIKGRAVPIFWRAYQKSVLKGRMKIYEAAVIKRCVSKIKQVIKSRRLILSADRGFADVDMCDLLQRVGVEFVLRVKAGTKVFMNDAWISLGEVRFVSNARRRSLGMRQYCKSDPHRLCIGLSRERNEQGDWEVWYLVSNRQRSGKQLAAEYGRRFGCEEGFRDAKRLLGFAQARIKDIQAWSRFFALFAFALLILMTLVEVVLLRDPVAASRLLRLVASRRLSRLEMSFVNAMLKLLGLDYALFDLLESHTVLTDSRTFA